MPTRRGRKPCQHCGTEGGYPRGLCYRCYSDKDIRSQYGSDSPAFVYSQRGEPTAEEVERCVAEQMQCLPEWWDSESRRMARLEGVSNSQSDE